MSADLTQTLTIPRPDDWHLHLRDGEMMRAVLPHTARNFGRAIVMPNLVPPVRTAADAQAYADRIREAIPSGCDFTPLMTLYLTETTDPDDLEAGFDVGLITAVKLYPAGATTNSDAGVRDLTQVDAVIERMAASGIPLLTHGEVTHAEVDIFDREARFIDDVLDPLRQRFPTLRVVMEHVTTEQAVAYVSGDQSGRLGATITVQHLMLNRNHMLVGGLRPHYYCLPVLKRARHQDALLRAATSGDQRFFLGTDNYSRAAPKNTPLTRPTSRKTPAAARVCSRHRTRSPVWHRPSRMPMRWIGWRVLSAASARASTACQSARRA